MEKLETERDKAGAKRGEGEDEENRQAGGAAAMDIIDSELDFLGREEAKDTLRVDVAGDDDNSDNESDGGEGEHAAGEQADVVKAILEKLSASFGNGLPTTPEIDLGDLLLLDDSQLHRLLQKPKVCNCREVEIDWDNRDWRDGIDPEIDAKAARKVASVLSRMDKLRRLRLDLWPDVVAAIVESLVASSATFQLEALTLSLPGTNPATWRSFSERFLTSVTALHLNFERYREPAEADIAAAAWNQVNTFPLLESLSMKIIDSDRHLISDARTALSSVHRVARSLVSIKLDLGRNRASPELLESLQSAVSSFRKSLKKLEVLGGHSVDPLANGIPPCDGSALLHETFLTGTLEELKFSNLSFTEATMDAARAVAVAGGLNFGAIPVKTIQFDGCCVEEACLVACHDLESLKLHNTAIVPSRRHGDGALSLFGNLERLARFEFGVCESSWTDRVDQHVRWISSNVARSRSLREVTLDVAGRSNTDVNCPALEHLVANFNRTCLVLDLGRSGNLYENFRFFRAGIEAATSLSRLKLRLRDELDKRVVSDLLQSLGRNLSLQFLDLDIRASSDEDAEGVGAAVQDYVSTNSHLSALAFAAEDDLSTFARAVYHMEGEEENLHRFVIRGIKENRRLRVLKLVGRMAASDSSELVSVLEKHNTTLAEIKGLRRGYESEADRAKIRQLLIVNRYLLSFDPAADYVTNARRVPVALWGDVLSRMSTDMCNRYVLELAQRAVAAAGDDGKPRGANLRRGAKRPGPPSIEAAGSV
jgi:hypothetical protein